MNSSEESRPLWLKYLVSYAVLAIVAVLGILLMQGMIMVITRIGLLLNFHRYVMTVIHQFGFVILGVLWLIGFFAIEGYLRNSVQGNRLWPRIGKVLAWELGLLLLVFVLQWLLY